MSLEPEQGKMETKVDAGQNHAYLKEMYETIYAWVRAGKLLDALKTSITMETHKHWGQ